MSSIAVSGARRRTRVRFGVSEPVRSLALVLSACYVAIGQYIIGEAPAYSFMAEPENVFLLVTLSLIVLPTVLLFAIGRWLRAHRGDDAVRKFHTGLILVAVLLYMRQAEIYSDQLNSVERELESIMPLLANVAFALAFAVAAVLILRLQKVAHTFFAFLAMPALILTMATPFARIHQSEAYDSYSGADVSTPDPSKPPVIVLVFDEFSAEALLDGQGEIDASRFPNFAQLGESGLFVPDAQSNFFHTWLQVPFLADSALAVASEYDPRLYFQLYRIERIYADACGSDYTCRGMRYITKEQELDLAFRLGARALTRPLPTRLLNLSGGIGLGAFDVLGVPPPSSTDGDMHILTKELFAAFLSDIGAEQSRGQLYLVHSLLPHVQYIYDDSGDYQSFDPHDYGHQRAVAPENLAGMWPHYLEQVEYADRLLGELVAKLKAEGLWDDTVLIVTADHGARWYFPEGPQPVTLEPFTPHVPLFIKAPGIGPETPHLPYQHVDLQPTLLDILGLEAPDTDRVLPELRALLSTGRSIFDQQDVTRAAPFYVNYADEVFWRYELDEATGTWSPTKTFNEPIPDKTSFK